MMEENKTKWKERQENENQRRLEREKADRLMVVKMKQEKHRRKPPEETARGNNSKMMEKKEREKRLAMQEMKTSLWTQRREKDGKLIKKWKKITDENLENKKPPVSPSSLEEDSK